MIERLAARYLDVRRPGEGLEGVRSGAQKTAGRTNQPTLTRQAVASVCPWPSLPPLSSQGRWRANVHSSCREEEAEAEEEEKEEEEGLVLVVARLSRPVAARQRQNPPRSWIEKPSFSLGGGVICDE